MENHPSVNHRTKWSKSNPGCWCRLWDHIFPGKCALVTNLWVPGFLISIFRSYLTQRPAVILRPLSEVPFMWRDACFGEMVWFPFTGDVNSSAKALIFFSFRGFNNHWKEQDASTNRALVLKPWSSTQTGQVEKLAKPVESGDLKGVGPMACRLRPDLGNPIFFVLVLKIQLYRVSDNETPCVVIQFTVWGCLQGVPRIWRFINAYHAWSMCIMVHRQVSILKQLFEGPILRQIHPTSSNNWAVPKTFVGWWFTGLYQPKYWGIISIHHGNPLNPV